MPSDPTDVRTGQIPEPTSRETFAQRFAEHFRDPRFEAERDALQRLEAIAWQNFDQGRKAPVTRKAGPGFADPDYDLSIDWWNAHEAIRKAAEKQKDAATPSRVLLINASPRNDGTCPGEMSKSWRMSHMARQAMEQAGIECDLLDLSRVTSEYSLAIHPCKGCVSTAMPLCHFPCSCYPNHGSHQVNDWMNEIYERFTAAHGVFIVAPTHWYQSPSVLKLMIDRLVCADGGNPDPTSTHGKKAVEAKAIEAKGWDFPKHLAGRVYGVVVHGDVAGVEVHRRNLTDWLDWMGLIPAGHWARLDRYIGYYQPYFDSHDTYDADLDVQTETENVGRAVAEAVRQLRAGTLKPPDRGVRPPRPK